jgi:hypothetical protein
VRRPLVWLTAAPFIACGVVAAHALAYELTGTPDGNVHHYLRHAPELLTVLALVGVATAGFARRIERPGAWPYPATALLAFVLQEHVEQLAHTGRVPWVVTTPVFLVGLLLQLPVALLTWLLVRGLLGATAELVPLRRPHAPRLLLEFGPPAGLALRTRVVHAAPARGPPGLRNL